MPAAGDSPDRIVSDAADALRHELLSSLTAIQGRTQLLAGDIRRSPTLAEDERVKMLASITAIGTMMHDMCAVIDIIDADGRGA